MKTEKITVAVSITRSYDYQSTRYELTEEVVLDEGDDRDQAILETRNRAYKEVMEATNKAYDKILEKYKK